MTSQTNPGNTSKEHSSSKSEEKIVYLSNYHCRSYQDGSKAWYLNNALHREDGPAVEYADGAKDWFINNKRHRIDGPAIEYPSGSKEWWINNQCHRIDGPAVERFNGHKEWWLNHILYGENNDFTNESWKHFQKTLIF